MSDEVQYGSYIQCVAGHFFDSRLREVCPVCGAGPASASEPASKTVVHRPVEAPTAPLPPIGPASVEEPSSGSDAGRIPTFAPVAAASDAATQVPPPRPSMSTTDPVMPVLPPPVPTQQEALIHCPNGHVYDRKTDSECPECKAAAESSPWARYLYILAALAAAGTVCIILWPHLKPAAVGLFPSSKPSIPLAAAPLPVIETFDAVPAEVNSGDAATLRWSTSNSTQIEIDPGVGVVVGQQALVHPAATTLYTLKASSQGDSTTRSILITVRSKSTPQPVIDGFTAQPNPVTRGQTAVLHWSVQNASTVSIDNGVGLIRSTQARVRPDSGTTYTITATNSAASVTRNVTLEVNAPPPPRAVIEAFTAAPDRIVSGQSAVLHWTARNATALTIDNAVGSVVGDQVSVHPTTTTTYTLVASGDANGDKRSVVVTVMEPAPIVRPQPQSGILRCQNVTVAPFGQVVFEHLPGGRLHFDVEPAGAWLILPQKQPDGTQKLILISRLSQPQTACTVRWEIAK